MESGYALCGDAQVQLYRSFVQSVNMKHRDGSLVMRHKGCLPDSVSVCISSFR
jgi:hypothetical protein